MFSENGKSCNLQPSVFGRLCKCCQSALPRKFFSGACERARYEASERGLCAVGPRAPLLVRRSESRLGERMFLLRSAYRTDLPGRKSRRRRTAAAGQQKSRRYLLPTSTSLGSEQATTSTEASLRCAVKRLQLIQEGNEGRKNRDLESFPGKRRGIP